MSLPQEDWGDPIDAAEYVQIAVVFRRIGAQFEMFSAFDRKREFIGNLCGGDVHGGFLPEDFSVDEDGDVSLAARCGGIVEGDAELEGVERSIEIVGKVRAGVDAETARVEIFATVSGRPRGVWLMPRGQCVPRKVDC